MFAFSGVAQSEKQRAETGNKMKQRISLRKNKPRSTPDSQAVLATMSLFYITLFFGDLLRFPFDS
jgi:hypothetical protein